MISLAHKIISDDNDRLQEKVLKLKNKISNIRIKNNLPREDIENVKLKDSNNKLEAENIKLKEENIKLRNLNEDIFVACKLFNTSIQNLLSRTNNKQIKKIFKNKEYEKLLSYSKFDVKYLFKRIRKDLDEIGDKILYHIIDNCLDLNVNVDIIEYTSTRLIHLFCRYASHESIKYLIDKGIELECQEKDGYYPVHLICEESSFQMAKYILNKGVNTKSNPKIDIVKIINRRNFASEEKNELISLI